MSYVRGLREAKVKYILKDKNACIALSNIGVYTVDDLMKCPFGKLIREPAVLKVWSDIIFLIFRLRTRE